MSDEKESPRVTSLKNQWELNKKAKKRVRIAGGKVETREASPPTQRLEDMVAVAVAAEKRQREEDIAQGIADAEPGEMVKGHGVFLGTWTLQDKYGISLTQTFNVFAAPENLPQQMTYEQAAVRVAGLKGWHGHDGTPYATDEQLYQALETGAYKGGWFIPPIDLLSGCDWYARPTTAANLYAHMEKGDLKGTVKINVIAGGGVGPNWYMSSTEYGHDRVYYFCVINGYQMNDFKDGLPNSCRPLRLELKP